MVLGLINVFNNYISISIGQRMVNDLRAEMFDHLQRLSLSFHRGRPIGDLMVRITYDTFSVQTIAMNGLFPLLSSIVMLAEMFVVMIRMDPELTIVALAVVPFLAALIATASKPIDRIAAAARVKESRLYTVAHRSLAAIHVVQAFTREAESYREFVESSSESLGETLRLYTLQTAYAGAVNVLIAIGTAVVIYIGALHALSGRLTIGDLIVFATYLASLYAPINQMFQTYGMVQGAMAGLRRCLELLEIEPEVRIGPARGTLGRARGDIEFDECRIRLRTRSSGAQGRELSAPAPRRDGRDRRAERRGQDHDGESAGTLLRTAAAARSASTGTIRAGFHAGVAAPQHRDGAPAAAGAVRHDALQYRAGPPGASQREIERAASAARLDPVIARLPAGLDEVVGQGGHSLSEGEAQRVTIARALLRDAPVLVMDEPTSALDAETESLVLDAVREAMRGRTTLVIAHRLSTIQNADRILVLRDGEIAEQGLSPNCFRAAASSATSTISSPGDARRPAKSGAATAGAP